MLEIIVQHFHGCPNGPKMLNNVFEAFKGLENIDFHEEIVDSPELAKKHNFRGSPTLLINGVDFEYLPGPENPSLSCRYYPNGVPSPEKIRDRIMELLK
jgi:hypothetical protein